MSEKNSTLDELLGLLRKHIGEKTIVKVVVYNDFVPQTGKVVSINVGEYTGITIGRTGNEAILHLAGDRHIPLSSHFTIEKFGSERASNGLDDTVLDFRIDFEKELNKLTIEE